MALETLFLDAGGVLVFPNWQRVSDTLGRHGVNVPADALWLADPHARFAIDNAIPGGTSTDVQLGWQYMDLVLEKAGVPRTNAVDAALEELRAYHARNNLWEYVPEEVVPALERLRALGLHLAVVSNSNGVLHRLFDRMDLTRHFDVICDSCVEGIEKPDPRFFHIALERAGARVETTMHVGDLYHVDVVGARRAGLRATLLDPESLYDDYDCERVRSLSALVGAVSRL